MAITFPLPDLANVLRIQSVKWLLDDNQEISGLGSGAIIVADLAPRYWTAEVTIDQMDHAEAARMQAKFESLDGSLNDFYLHDPRLPYPQSDPKGTVIAAWPGTVTISAVNSNRKQIKLAGLPANYILTEGDMLSFDYGSNPVHRALHRFVSPIQATAGGVTDWIELRPHLSVGAVAGLTVSLAKPAARVKLVPKSFNPGTGRHRMTSGMMFNARQVV